MGTPKTPDPQLVAGLVALAAAFMVPVLVPLFVSDTTLYAVYRWLVRWTWTGLAP